MSENESSSADRTRRDFLKTAAGATALGLTGGAAQALGGEAAAGAIPKRTLGRTGLEVTLLGFGGGSRFLTPKEDDSVAMLEKAVAEGITYFDTAADYGENRESERRYGLALPRHRKSIILATKSAERTYDGFMRSVETSLKLLKTDTLDLMQMHNVGPGDDITAWDKPTGAVTALRKLKDQKVVRFMGFTGHQEAATHKKVIETFDFDTVLMALNAAPHKGFRDVALPAAVAKKMGIIGMKVARDLVGTGAGKADIQDLLHYAWDLPVATTIVGMPGMSFLEDNLRTVRAYVPGRSKEVPLAARLSREVPPTQLSWAQPGYEDRCA